MRGISAIETWGSTAAERAERYPCDDLMDGPHREFFRAVDVDAPAGLVFRWLCQLRVAPYSYALVDNFGRRSPRHFVAGVEDLAVGQRVMRIFRLVSFEPGRSITLDSTTTLFGRVVATYLVRASGSRRSRLVVKLGVARRRRLFGFVMDRVLPLGDLVMMRKQLLTLKALAERDARDGRG